MGPRVMISPHRFFQTSASHKPEDEQEIRPGRKAFADIEYDALIDLFQSHCNDQQDALDRSGIHDLLESIGQPSDDQMVEEIFRKGDLNGDGVISLEEFLICADDILGDAPARIVLIVGGPGAGKGFLCQQLEQNCNVVHLSSGALLRAEVERDTVLGREVAGIMERGDLVSSALIVALIRRHMLHHPGKRVLLDGFPRSLENARDLVTLCGKPEMALHCECPDTVMLERILKRKENRADDNFETALERIKTYHKYHGVCMDFLRSEGIPIVNLDCSTSKDNVWNQLLAIGRLMRPAVKVPSQTTLSGPLKDEAKKPEDDDHEEKRTLGFL
jgi:adenylate kinase family enzyme